jgi:hypothetical protein
MPINKDTSPNIKWPLPEGIPAFSVKNFFPEDILETIKETIAEQAKWGPGSEGIEDSQPYHTIPGRWTTEVSFPERVWEYIESKGKENWKNDSLKLKIVWLARYQQYRGSTPYLWEHMDQPATQYTMDVCIESPGVPNWGLTIDGERFDEEENSAVFFMGQQQTHSRPPYPVDNPEAYIVLLFALFVSPDHWMYDIDAYSEEDAELLFEMSNKYKLDGDIRYYEHTGHAPYFNDLPENNKPCAEDCIQCDVVPEDFTNHIEGYIKLEK